MTTASQKKEEQILTLLYQRVTFGIKSTEARDGYIGWPELDLPDLAMVIYRLRKKGCDIVSIRSSDKRDNTVTYMLRLDQPTNSFGKDLVKNTRAVFVVPEERVQDIQADLQKTDPEKDLLITKFPILNWFFKRLQNANK